MATIKIKTPRVFLALLEPARYKGIWGGRGSGKSHFFAERLIEDSLYHKGLRSVCLREVQKSLKESAKRLLEDKLAFHGLGEADGFKIFREVIETPGDGIINFQGMQDHTAESIKSLEGVRRFWFEEAQTCSPTSLMMLRPTMRADDGEMWFPWNPRRKKDPVDEMFRSKTPPTGAIVVRANWSDNPFFPKSLEQERLDCLKNDAEQYNHIWEGDYATVLTGAYYAEALATARLEGRIGKVARDPLMQTYAVWDIGGNSDATAIWICQFIGREIRVLDYYEAVGQPVSAHVNWLRSRKYSDAICILPHDGATHDNVYIKRYEDHLADAGFSTETIKNQGKGAALQRVEITRRLFPRIWFNEATTAAGIDALGWYHEKRDDKRAIGLGPSHDWASHGADAFGLMCIKYKEPTSTSTYVEARRDWVV